MKIRNVILLGVLAGFLLFLSSCAAQPQDHYSACAMPEKAWQWAVLPLVLPLDFVSCPCLPESGGDGSWYNPGANGYFIGGDNNGGAFSGNFGWY